MSSLTGRIRKVVNRLGYDVRRLPSEQTDLPLYYKLYGKEAVEKRRFYNVGAGSFRHPAWTNVDHASDWYEDILGDAVSIDWDLLSVTPIPVEDGTACLVYSSHTMEHITDTAAQHFLNEAYRVLRPGGIIRVTMPDVNLNLQAYRNRDRSYYYWKEMYVEPEQYRRVHLNCPMTELSSQQLFLWEVATSLSPAFSEGEQDRVTDAAVDSLFEQFPAEEALDMLTARCSPDFQARYPGCHINWWNEDKLTRMLSRAGFTKIYRSGYGQSVTPVLRNTELFDNTKPAISIYMEAVKAEN